MKIRILIILSSLVLGASSVEAKSRLHFVSLLKAKFSDPSFRKELGASAIAAVSDAVRWRYPQTIHYRLEESARMTVSRAYESSAISSEKFTKFIRQLSKRVDSDDTVVIYTHSHGSRSGLILNEYADPEHGRALDIMPWDELGELLLAIPAKNVVVFTASCFSGNLTTYLNSVSHRWIDRPQQGRNFLVITSQNDRSLSKPVPIRGVLMNGLPYGVSQAFYHAGASRSDGGLSFRDLAKFVYQVSRSAGSTWYYFNDSQILGAYNPHERLLQ